MIVYIDKTFNNEPNNVLKQNLCRQCDSYDEPDFHDVPL